MTRSSLALTERPPLPRMRYVFSTVAWLRSEETLLIFTKSRESLQTPLALLSWEAWLHPSWHSERSI